MMDSFLNNEILISVVVPTYNRAHLLPRTIESILSQNIPNLQIIVADDASQDNTRDYIDKISAIHGCITYVESDVNKGEGATRTLGTKAAKGKYIAFLDSDDEWLPNKLSKQISFLEEHECQYDGVISDYHLVDENGEKILIEPGLFGNNLSSKNLLQKGCNLCLGSSPLIRKKVFEKIGFFDESLPIFVDLDWICRFSNAGFKLGKVPESLLYYYKAPMRNGDFLKKGAISFKEKNRDYLRQFSTLDRMKIESQFYNYESQAYAVNGPLSSFLKTRFLYFVLNPIRRPGDYFASAKKAIELMINIFKNL